MQATATVKPVHVKTFETSAIFGSDLTKRKRGAFENSSQSSVISNSAVSDVAVESNAIASLEQRILQKALILQSKAALNKGANASESAAKLIEMNQNGHPTSPRIQQLMSEEHNELTPKKSAKDLIPTSDDESGNQNPLSMSTSTVDHDEPKCVKKVNVNSEVFRLSSEENEDFIDEIAGNQHGNSENILESYDTVPEVSQDVDFEGQVNTFRIKLIKLEVAVTRMEAEMHQNTNMDDIREAKALNVQNGQAISLGNSNTTTGASLKQKFDELQAFFMNFSNKTSQNTVNNNLRLEQPPTYFKH